jgi:aldehyde dehydrogenase (NAD+)
MTLLAHFIAGADAPDRGGQVRERYNPADRGDLTARFPIADPETVHDAVSSASNAFDAWRRLPGPVRGEHLHRWAEALSARSATLAELITREVGKPAGEARGEVARAVAICRYYAGEAVREVGEVIPAQTTDTLQYTLRDPLGVVALITPWNFPVAIPLWKAAPALAFGNTVVIKPSELSPAVSRGLVATAVDAGLPPGVFNLIFGDGTTGDALTRHPGVNAISFTGSQRVGQRVSQVGAERNIRTQCEMGGKNVVIVAADADLERAARFTAAGAFRYAGQKCTATSRLIVVEAVAEEFLRQLEAATVALQLGPADHPASAVGPLISADAHQRVMASMKAAPAPTLFEIPLPQGDYWQAGNWLTPRALRLDGANHPLAREELFAPVLGVMVADDLEHVIEMANDTTFGLSASLFTRDLRTAFDYVRRIEVGLVRVNGDTTGVDLHAPFGGLKSSSSGGREQGRAARDFYTEIRTIQIHA